MGSLAFVVFGGSRFLSCGADSTITPIFAGSLGIFAASGAGDYAGLSAALALMVGIVLVGGGIFRLGWIADLLSMPVMTGFLAGVSAHIFLSQLPAVLGLASPDGTLPQRKRPRRRSRRWQLCRSRCGAPMRARVHWLRPGRG
jgi:MFS superfamily sulfate permease-like transporter